VLRVYRRHYNEHCPHRALDLLPPEGPILSSNRERHNSYAAATSSADSSTNTKPPHEFANPTGIKLRVTGCVGTKDSSQSDEQPACLCLVGFHLTVLPPRPAHGRVARAPVRRRRDLAPVRPPSRVPARGHPPRAASRPLR
jgi:hypothetical protein